MPFSKKEECSIEISIASQDQSDDQHPPPTAITKSGEYLSGGEFDSDAESHKWTINPKPLLIFCSPFFLQCNDQNALLFEEAECRAGTSGANREITRDFCQASIAPRAAALRLWRPAAVSFTRWHRLNYLTEGGDLTRELHGESLG